MKKQVQQTGVRKWFGDDWISMQDELFSVLEGFFGSYGQQFILSGCVVAGNDIGAGIVGLIDGEGFHICRFNGVQGVAWPVYFYPTKITENRAYLDNQVKPVSEAWTVATSGNNPGGYFQLKQDGTSAQFFDAIQTINRRFVTDAEKTNYLAQASSAITAVRGGVVADYDTLAKIVTLLLLKANTNSPALTGIPTAPTASTDTNTTQLATTAFVKAVVAALVASSPAALDTLNELAIALGNDPNFATTMTNALAGKEPANANIQSHIASQANPHNTTKAHIGLGSVDNTSDVNKPVSTATQTALNLKANLTSPALTGTPTAPTAALGTNNTQIATTAFIQSAVAALVASSPAALNTLNELATALGNDPNFATTMTNALAGKEPANANIQSHIASQANPHNTTKAHIGLGSVDNTSDVNKPVSTATQTALNLKANLTSPALTGVPTAPTAALGTNNTQIATTAFIQSAVAALVASSPAALDTLNELAIALGNDPNFATTMTNALAGKVANNDARLSDLRTPTDLSVTYRKVANNLKTKASVTSVNDLSANGIGAITLTANTAFSFTNFELNKNYLLIVTANGYTPSFAVSSNHVLVEGNAVFGTSGVFYISLTCIDATAGSEKLVTMIMKGA